MRLGLLLLLAAWVTVAVAGEAFADPPAAPPAKGAPAKGAPGKDAPAKDGDAKDADAADAGDDDTEGSAWTQKKFEKVLKEKPAIALVSALLKFGPLLIGLVLLVLLYLRNDRIKGGMLPAPQKVEPTVPTSGAEAAWLCLGAFLVIPLVAKPFIVDEGNLPTLHQMFLLTAIGILPVAFVVVFRRLRLARPRPPSVAKGTLLGSATFCIAVATVLPVSFVWFALLIGLGKPPEIQDLVRQVMEPTNPDDPYLIAIYGVIIAPFGEEAVFRGMLYPLGRKLLGGDRRAVITSAVVTSAMFAAVHRSLSVFVPLFVLALVLTWVFERTNSLAAVVVAHSLNNMTSLVPLLLYHWI